MGPYRPPTSQEDLERTMRLGASKFHEDRPPTWASLFVTLAWIGALVLIGWVLLQSGLLDLEMCRGTRNPLSC